MQYVYLFYFILFETECRNIYHFEKKEVNWNLNADQKLSFFFSHRPFLLGSNRPSTVFWAFLPYNLATIVFEAIWLCACVRPCASVYVWVVLIYKRPFNYFYVNKILDIEQTEMEE